MQRVAIDPDDRASHNRETVPIINESMNDHVWCWDNLREPPRIFTEPLLELLLIHTLSPPTHNNKILGPLHVFRVLTLHDLMLCRKISSDFSTA